MIKRKLPAPSALRNNIWSVATVLCVGVFWLPFASHAADDNKAQLQTLQQSIAAKEKSVQQQKNQRSTLLSQLQQQEKTIAQASRSLHETQGTLDKLTQDITRLTRSIEKLQQQQASQKKALATQLDAAFRQGQHSAVELIFSGEDSQRSERMLAYFGYLNQARQKTIDGLKTSQIQLAEQKKSLVAKQSQQN